MTKKCTFLSRRIVLGSALGIIFGLLCFAGFSSNSNMPAEMVKYQVWSWSNMMMWSTIANRFTIGVVVAIAGFITKHPMLDLRIPAYIRGAKVGLLISLPLALGALMGPNPELAKQGFWMVLIFGGIIGMIIDLVITKIAGEGEKLNQEIAHCCSHNKTEDKTKDETKQNESPLDAKEPPIKEDDLNQKID
ncbi:hypothetical protein HOD96_00170 [Candidatus Falkowbacteria bacterium]|jgi:hypothetical protein|nr:hypothetical protein [Candidatus Falkowbacteria bacterium]MBT4432825.1 hypothetical protein [Candidatus Falkowbacteria bacterium]